MTALSEITPFYFKLEPKGRKSKKLWPKEFKGKGRHTTRDTLKENQQDSVSG